MPAVVKPGMVQVIALEPEFLVPQDGHEKQDCESKAAKRWIEEFAARYSFLGITLLGDGLYATKPMIETVVEAELDYIFVVKSTNHKYLYEELEALGKLGEIRELKRTQGTGKKRRHLLYRCINAVPLTGGEKSVEVNRVELPMTDDSGKVTFHSAFVTIHSVTEQNVEELVEAGWCRWRIENEDLNALEAEGCHFEHLMPYVLTGLKLQDPYGLNPLRCNLPFPKSIPRPIIPHRYSSLNKEHVRSMQVSPSLFSARILYAGWICTGRS